MPFPTQEYFMSFNTGSRPTPQSWVLPNGQAQTFVSDTAGVLRIQSGRAWVTMNCSTQYSESVARPPIADDDLFLDSTTSLPLQAGQIIVLESWSVRPATDVTLVWEAVVLNASTQRWQQSVLQPAHELAQGLIQAGRAFVKMVQGLLVCTLLPAPQGCSKSALDL
jgi:hypothetical protein